MKKKAIIERSKKFIKPYRVTDGKKFRLKDIDPSDTGDVTSEDKPLAKELLESGIEVLAELQDVLYAQDQWSLLLIFQAMDAAGKDGAIKHVMSGVNPQGCQVYSFKSPSAEDLVSLLRGSKAKRKRGPESHRFASLQGRVVDLQRIGISLYPTTMTPHRVKAPKIRQTLKRLPRVGSKFECVSYYGLFSASFSRRPDSISLTSGICGGDNSDGKSPTHEWELLGAFPQAVSEGCDS